MFGRKNLNRFQRLCYIELITFIFADNGAGDIAEYKLKFLSICHLLYIKNTKSDINSTIKRTSSNEKYGHYFIYKFIKPRKLFIKIGAKHVRKTKKIRIVVMEKKLYI